MIKIGSGELTLAGLNSYAGSTTITAGTLQIGNGGSSGSPGSGPITNNAALLFNRNDNGLVIANSISGSGSLTQIGAGTVTLSGSNPYTGGTFLTAGTLALGNSQALENTTLAVGGQAHVGFCGLASATFGRPDRRRQPPPRQYGRHSRGTDGRRRQCQHDVFRHPQRQRHRRPA